MTQQIALKLEVAEDRHGVLLRHPALLRAISREQHHLVSIYYDTGRMALRRAGILLRLRRNGASWLQTIKRQDRSDGGLTQRPEWQGPYLNHFDFSQLDDADLRDWLQRDKIAGCLAAVFETNLRRTVWQLERGPGTRILVKLDRGWIASNGRRASISELELQLLAGSVDSLYALALELAQRLALPPLLLSKAERGYRLFLDTPPAPVKAGEVAIDAADTPLAAFRLIALDCLSHLQLNHDGAVHSDDPEYVHQMRVATRRLRAALRMFRPVLPAGFSEQLLPSMREMMQALGQARDLDVLMTEIVAPVASALPDEPRLADLAGAITNRRYAARGNIRHVLRQPGYGQLLLTAGKLLHDSPFVDSSGAGGRDESQSLLHFADRRLRRQLKAILELAAAARADYPPSLHALRIGIKRLRYAIEFFGPMLPGKSGTAAIKRLAGLQEELGQLNDLASAGTLLMVCAGRDQALREAVTLIGGWHGPRHAALLGDIPDKLKRIRGLDLPRLAQ
ncbi:MAG: CYTH and CHAD domain-containing protein [Sulfuritalea sp.]|nr:CYTH and CHAD domain-containing protein [Sulfuritalea sp.]MDP1981450.1 CYTH and CHAD domain-containing protein [Sulfuritalea sp.]